VSWKRLTIVEPAVATGLPPQDCQPFIARLEQGQAEGLFDYVDANMPELERLIRRLQDRIYELAHLQYRVRAIRDRHDPPAEKRKEQR